MKFSRLSSYLFFCFLIFGHLWTNGPKTSVYETHTAISLDKGEYIVDGFFYGGGNIFAKFGVGVNKHINLGAMVYSDGLLGYGKNRWYIPNVSLKIRFTGQPDEGHNVAIGFDSFYQGAFSSSKNEKIYGAYAVYSKGFFLGESFDFPSIFSVGVRYPLIYELGQPNVFSSLYFSLFQFLDIATEIHNIHFAKQYEYYFIFNNMLVLKLVESLSIHLIFQLAMDETSNKNRKSKLFFSRGIRITFNSFF